MHNVTPSGTYGSTFSYPAVSVCATFSFGIRAMNSGCALTNMYGSTKNSTSPIESGTPPGASTSVPVNTSAVNPSGTSFADCPNGTHTWRGLVCGMERTLPTTPAPLG